MLTRTNPSVGYLEQDVYKTHGFTQTVRSADRVYLSGVVALRGDEGNLEVVGHGDLRAAGDLEVMARHSLCTRQGNRRSPSRVP